MENVNNWVDTGGWEKFYLEFNKLTIFDQNEIREAVTQSSSVVLLFYLQEASALFINSLQNIPSVPIKRVNFMIIRYEYQKYSDNNIHIYLTLEILWRYLNEYENKFVTYLIWASIIDISRSNEVQSLVDEGIFEFFDYHKAVIKYSNRFMPHCCNLIWLIRIGPGTNDFIYRKLN